MAENAEYFLYAPDWFPGDYSHTPGLPELSADFVSANISRGFSDPMGRVARVARATIVLNNENRQYSPGFNSDIVPRVPIELLMTYDFVTEARFTGYVDEIRPYSGRWESRRVELVCSDAMALLQQADAQIPLSVDVRANEIINDIVDDVLSPPSPNYEEGMNLFTVSADRWAWEVSGQAVEETTAAAKIGDVCLADWGIFFIDRDGNPVFYNRNHMPLDDTIVMTLDGSMQELNYKLSVSSVRNAVDVTCYPRTIGDINEVLGRISQDDAPIIEAGDTRTFVLEFRDPSNQKINVGGKDCIVPVASTDYVCTDDVAGEGSDVTASVNVTADFYGDHAEVELENTAGDPVYIQKLQVRGLAVRAREPVKILVSDATSIAENRRWTLSIDTALMDNQVQAQALAEHLLDRHKDPRAIVDGIRVVANTSPTLMEAVRDMELCQRVSISEHQTGLSSYEGYIWQLQETIAGTIHAVTLGLIEAYALPGDPGIWDSSRWDGGDVWIY